MIAGINTHNQLIALERGNEVIYKGLRTRVVLTVMKPTVYGNTKWTCFVALENGAVLTSDDGDDPKVIRTFPAFGEDTSAKF